MDTISAWFSPILFPFIFLDFFKGKKYTQVGDTHVSPPPQTHRWHSPAKAVGSKYLFINYFTQGKAAERGKERGIVSIRVTLFYGVGLWGKICDIVWGKWLIMRIIIIIIILF